MKLILLRPGQPLKIDHDDLIPGEFMFSNTWGMPFITPTGIVPDGKLKFHLHVDNLGYAILTNLSEASLGIESEERTHALENGEFVTLPPHQDATILFRGRHSNKTHSGIIEIVIRPLAHQQIVASLLR